jgi:ABC-type Mn2+/Zn2+ transport system permease subunit
VLGHNYGTGYPGWPYLGILAMCCFCIVLGTLLSYLAWRTQSVWPAAIGHGSGNAIAGLGLYLTADGGNPFVGPAPTGYVGGLAFLLLAVAVFILWSRQKQRTPTE